MTQEEIFMEPSLPTLDIVLVDNDTTSRKFILKIFQEIEQNEPVLIHAHHSEDLIHAITHLEEHHCDLILLDGNFDDQDLCSTIKKIHQVFYFCPTVVISKDMSAGDQITLVQAGVDDCLEYNVLNARILHRVMGYAIQRARNYRAINFNHNLQGVVNRLLRLSLKGLELTNQMDICLEEISSTAMISANDDIAIFVFNDEADAISIRATKNFPANNLIEITRHLSSKPRTCSAVQKELDIEHTILKSICYQNRPLGLLAVRFINNRFTASDKRYFCHEVTDCLANIIEVCIQDQRMQRIYKQNGHLIESISSAIIGIDSNDCVTHWNKTAERYFNRTADEVIGKPILLTEISWDWSKIVLHLHQSLVNQTGSQRFETGYKNAQGEDAILSMSITPRFDGTGLTSGYLLLIDDITEQRTQEQQEQQNQRLQSIGQLSAGIAHEINTPIQYVSDNLNFIESAFGDLTSLLSKAEIMAQHHTNEDATVAFREQSEEIDLEYLMEEMPEAISQTQDGLNQVSTIVRAMKDFSHPGSQKMHHIDLNNTLNSTLTISKSVWKYIASVELDLADNLPQLECFPGPINEVFLNIIVNAADAIEEKYGADCVANGIITVSSKQDDDWLEVNIADNGNGVPAKIKERVFDQFFTTKVVGKGTGQGLALSHRIITEQHKGSLSFDSTEGEGTRFTIRLPISIGGSDECRASTRKDTLCG